jgi:hypothetical protein
MPKKIDMGRVMSHPLASPDGPKRAESRDARGCFNEFGARKPRSNSPCLVSAHPELRDPAWAAVMVFAAEIADRR